jgi:hypothetical protein
MWEGVDKFIKFDNCTDMKKAKIPEIDYKNMETLFKDDFHSKCNVYIDEDYDLVDNKQALLDITTDDEDSDNQTPNKSKI